MKKEKNRKTKKILSIFILSFVIAITLWCSFLFVLSLIIKPYTIKGHSMSPTLLENEIIATYSNRKDFKKGDIVVIKKEGMKDCPEEEKKEQLIKRVVAVAGEEIAFIINNDAVDFYIKDGDNWNIVKETFIDQPMSINSFMNCPYLYNSINEIENGLIIEENQIYIMGDNRNNSFDSRIYGTFNIDYICNIMWFNISRNGFLNFVYTFFL